MQHFENSSVNYVFSIFQNTFQLRKIYYCFAVLKCDNLNLFDIHETAHFIGVAAHTVFQ